MTPSRDIPQGTLSKLLKDSWNLFTKHFQMIMLITLAISVPLHLLSALFDSRTETISADEGLWQGLASSIFGVQGLVVIVLVTLAGLLIPVALAVFIRKAARGRVLKLAETFQEAFSRWPSAMVTGLLAGIFLFGLFILLVVPGILFAVWWFFALYAVALSNKSGIDALRYSKKLVEGRWWTIFGYLLLFAIITGIITSILTWPIPSAADSYFGSVMTGIISDLVASFFVVASVLLFLWLEQGTMTSDSSPKQR